MPTILLHPTEFHDVSVKLEPLVKDACSPHGSNHPLREFIGKTGYVKGDIRDVFLIARYVLKKSWVFRISVRSKNSNETVYLQIVSDTVK